MLALLCYAFSLGTSNALLMLRTKLPHVLNAAPLTFFIELPELSPGALSALSSFGFGKKKVLLQLND